MSAFTPVFGSHTFVHIMSPLSAPKETQEAWIPVTAAIPRITKTFTAPAFHPMRLMPPCVVNLNAQQILQSAEHLHCRYSQRKNGLYPVTPPESGQLIPQRCLYLSV